MNPNNLTTMDNQNFFKSFVLAPYIMKASVLIGIRRKTGGNQFRHSFSTLGILLDYKYFDDPILLKASLLHDVVEDIDYQDLNEIMNIDNDAPSVLSLVLEVTRRKDETKVEYLERVQFASRNAKILKCADRIQNLTDLHLDTHTNQKISDYLDQTEKYILPLAREVNLDFEKEIVDLIKVRRNMCV